MDENEITCDYMVPMTVRVNVETGEAVSVWLHLESFQSSQRGRFTQTDADGKVTETYFRNAFSDRIEKSHDGRELYGYGCDGENELADQALAIGDRVTLHPNDIEIELKGWTLDDE